MQPALAAAARLVGPAKWRGRLYRVAEFPGAVPCYEDEFVAGELYELGDDAATLLAQLDAYEETPDDYVLATKETHTVKEFVEAAFGHAGLNWQDHVKYDARYERPAEVELLIGDPAKAKAQLGWEPTTKFDGLVKIMVDADIAALEGRKTA